MKTLEQWAEHHDIYEMHGTGSGCSYHNLVEWSRPAWEYQQKRIEELEEKLNAKMKRSNCPCVLMDLKFEKIKELEAKLKLAERVIEHAIDKFRCEIHLLRHDESIELESYLVEVLEKIKGMK